MFVCNADTVGAVKKRGTMQIVQSVLLGVILSVVPVARVTGPPHPKVKKPPVIVPGKSKPKHHYVLTKKVRVCISAYSPNDPRQGTGWKTASGRHASHPGVATDPRVIPTGSIVEINGTKYLADDTGGAIKGRRIDLRVTSRGAAIKWGRRTMTVKVYRKVKRG